MNAVNAFSEVRGRWSPRLNTLEGNPVQLGREVGGRKDRDQRSEVGGRKDRDQRSEVGGRKDRDQRSEVGGR